MVTRAMIWSGWTPPKDQAGRRRARPPRAGGRLKIRAARTLPRTNPRRAGALQQEQVEGAALALGGERRGGDAGATTAAARMTHRPTAPNRKMARLATSRLVLVVDVVEKSAGAALASGARISMPSRKTSSETNKTSSVNAAKVSRPRSQVWNSLMTRGADQRHRLGVPLRQSCSADRVAALATYRMSRVISRRGPWQ